MTYKENNNYYIGLRETFEKKVVEEDIIQFAKISGDCNPVHLDKDFAEQSVFGGQIAHGIYTASLISKVIGMQMPGQGTIYLSQNCRFLKPAYIGDVLKVVVEIVEIGERNRAKLSTKVYNQKNELILDGEAKVLLPKRG